LLTKDLLILALTLASMVYTSSEDLDWLRKEVKMMDDILTDNWFYQYLMEKAEAEVEAKGLEKGLEQGRHEGHLEASRQMAIKIIQAHFPEMAQQAQKVVSQVTDFQQLEHLNLDLYIARDAAEVAQLLSALSNKAD
jgi:predicted transposase YdaD